MHQYYAYCRRSIKRFHSAHQIHHEDVKQADIQEDAQVQELLREEQPDDQKEHTEEEYQEQLGEEQPEVQEVIDGK